jgi:hypothetical protein
MSTTSVQINHAVEFSRAVASAPDRRKDPLLCQLVNLIADQFDSKVYQNC